MSANQVSEFERGVRFVMERTQSFNKGSGPEVTQFGDYQMTMVERPAAELLKGSADHRERTVRAILNLAAQDVSA